MPDRTLSKEERVAKLEEVKARYGETTKPEPDRDEGEGESSLSARSMEGFSGMGAREAASGFARRHPKALPVRRHGGGVVDERDGRVREELYE